jgi:hypothetical protein
MLNERGGHPTADCQNRIQSPAAKPKALLMSHFFDSIGPSRISAAYFALMSLVKRGRRS